MQQQQRALHVYRAYFCRNFVALCRVLRVCMLRFNDIESAAARTAEAMDFMGPGRFLERIARVVIVQPIVCNGAFCRELRNDFERFSDGS